MPKKKKLGEWFYFMIVLLLLATTIYALQVAFALRWLIILFITLLPILSYLVYRNTFSFIKNRKDFASAALIVSFIVAMSIVSQQDKFESYIGEQLVDGHTEKKLVWDETEEGEEFQKEKYVFEPDTKKGENMINILSWGLTIICVGSVLTNYRIYSILYRQEKHG